MKKRKYILCVRRTSMNFEKIIVLDFGSPSSQKLTRKIREFGTYSELHTSSLSATDMEEMNPVGIILAGGPFRDYKNFAPYDEELFDLDIPILGIGHEIGRAHV